MQYPNLAPTSNPRKNQNQNDNIQNPAIALNESFIKDIINRFELQENKYQKTISELRSEIQGLKNEMTEQKLHFNDQILSLKEEILQLNHRAIQEKNQSLKATQQISLLEQSSRIYQQDQQNLENTNVNPYSNNNNNQSSEKSKPQDYLDIIKNPSKYKIQIISQENEEQEEKQQIFEPQKVDTEKLFGNNENILKDLSESNVEYNNFVQGIQSPKTLQPQNNNQQGNHTHFAEEIQKVGSQKVEYKDYTWIPYIEVDLEIEKHLENYIKKNQLSLKYISSREHYCEKRFTKGELRSLQKNLNYQFTNVKKIQFQTLETEQINIFYIKQKIQNRKTQK